MFENVHGTRSADLESSPLNGRFAGDREPEMGRVKPVAVCPSGHRPGAAKSGHLQNRSLSLWAVMVHIIATRKTTKGTGTNEHSRERPSD